MERPLWGTRGFQPEAANCEPLDNCAHSPIPGDNEREPPAKLLHVPASQNPASQPPEALLWQPLGHGTNQGWKTREISQEKRNILYSWKKKKKKATPKEEKLRTFLFIWLNNKRRTNRSLAAITYQGLPPPPAKSNTVSWQWKIVSRVHKAGHGNAGLQKRHHRPLAYTSEAILSPSPTLSGLEHPKHMHALFISICDIDAVATHFHAIM